MTINVPGPWMGARVYVCPDATTGRLRTELIPQLAFRRKGEENWVWFTVTELRATSTESLAKYRTETETRIIGPSERSCKYLRSMLTKLGVRFTEKGKLGDPITEGGGIRVYVEYTIDKTILRAIAKIAFNYFAYVHGADLALRGDFDSIRKFIRSGQEPPWKPVIPGRRRILAGETDMIRCTDGHLLVLEGDPRASSITARVALFNDITYVVRLCLRFSGVWRSFDAGHHFDITSREVTPLRAIPSYLLPMAPVHTTLPQPLLR
ncbi:MAG TPA: hypothetical protein VG028_12685 [Terriglobia bacterium]|nr:hypothetical protein [Terriglobia bacterium]